PARELEVVGVVAGTLDEARILFAFQLLAHPNRSQLRGSLTVSFAISRHDSSRSGACRDALRHLAGGVLHGIYDVLVAGAAADIAIDGFAVSCIGCSRMIGELVVGVR